MITLEDPRKGDKPWRFFVCLPCKTPMTKPIRHSDEHACPSCQRCIDGWYPPADVEEVPVVRGNEVVYNGHAVLRDFEKNTHTVDGVRGPLGLSELAGVKEALMGAQCCARDIDYDGNCDRHPEKK